MTSRTPLFAAEHSERYERQKIIREYQELTSAKLIVIIDSISPTNMTIMEELLVDLTKEQDLHLILCSPGGDGETAIRMVRSMQQRCRELTVIVPDMAKSAATIICLGAHHILMGPGGDLGPIDPQMILRDDDGLRTVANAKEIVAAVVGGKDYHQPCFLPPIRLQACRRQHADGRAGQGCTRALRGLDDRGTDCARRSLFRR